MLRKVESTSDVNRGPEPCQSGTALTFPVLCLAYTRGSMVQCGRMRMRMTTITLRVQNLTLSILTEIITSDHLVQFLLLGVGSGDETTDHPTNILVSSPDPTPKKEEEGLVTAFLVLASSAFLLLRKPIRLQLHDFHVTLHLVAQQRSCNVSWRFSASQ